MASADRRVLKCIASLRPVNRRPRPIASSLKALTTTPPAFSFVLLAGRRADYSAHRCRSPARSCAWTARTRPDRAHGIGAGEAIAARPRESWTAHGRSGTRFFRQHAREAISGDLVDDDPLDRDCAHAHCPRHGDADALLRLPSCGARIAEQLQAFGLFREFCHCSTSRRRRVRPPRWAETDAVLAPAERNVDVPNAAVVGAVAARPAAQMHVDAARVPLHIDGAAGGVEDQRRDPAMRVCLTPEITRDPQASLSRAPWRRGAWTPARRLSERRTRRAKRRSTCYNSCPSWTHALRRPFERGLSMSGGRGGAQGRDDDKTLDHRDLKKAKHNGRRLPTLRPALSGR